MRSTEPDDYVDLRAEWYWKLRERFERGDIDIDPYDKELAKQLVKIKWSLTSRGQVKIESKKEMRARGLPSPDRATPWPTPSRRSRSPGSTSRAIAAKASPGI
jgi:hypothetical protein